MFNINESHIIRSRVNSANQYNFTTVESSDIGVTGITSNSGISNGNIGLWSANIKDLKPHTEYEVVIQAYNSKGTGPMSTPISVTTREDCKYLYNSNNTFRPTLHVF